MRKGMKKPVIPITETVNLPDPSVQPLVHPLDLPEARREFRKAWLIDSLSNAAVCLCLAAIVWFLTESWVPPAFVFAATLGFGWMARRWSLREAWEFIPRKRQDRARPLPAFWTVGSAVTLAIVLAAASVLLGLRLARPDVTLGVREVCIGGAVAACVLGAVTIAAKLILRRRPAVEALSGLLPLAGVVTGVVVGYYAMFRHHTIENWGISSWSNAGIGAALVVVAGVASWLWKAQERRTARSAAAD